MMQATGTSTPAVPGAEYVLLKRNKKLAEVFHLVADPLLSRISQQETDGLKEFLQDHPPGSQFVLQDLATGHQSLESLLTSNVNERLLRPPLPSAPHTNKRPASPAEGQPATKLAKSSPSHVDQKLLLKGSTDEAIALAVGEPKNEFLDRDIADLDIMTMPEHYPTKPHVVSALAELYYLTQTLPLVKLIPSGHKTLMTENFELALLEGKIAVLYSRIEELKRQGKWSLRQPIKHREPIEGSSHWRNVLAEGKWMATDFKELSKYKRACCWMMAQAVADYWTYGKEATCVKTRPPRERVDADGVGETISDAAASEAMRGREEEEEEERFDDAKAEASSETIDVLVLLSNQSTRKEEQQAELALSDAVVNPVPRQRKRDNSPFKLHVTLEELKKIDQSLVNSLPKFTAFDEPQPKKALIQKTSASDAPITAVSRLLYPLEQDDEWYKVILKESSSNTKHLKPVGPPEYQKGLFGFQAHRRFNSLKPPKPPLIKNIEFRSPTIWLPQEDKHLIHYVAEFCFNWQLISEHLLSSAASLKRYESNIERRTPWQCFERYIQLNEKFQFSDMKGVYSYQAQQWLEQAHKAQLTTKRRISPLGVGNESIQRGHRRLRWASMFDAMRKAMKKRENAQAKTSTRRTNEYGPGATNSGAAKRLSDKVPTPAELSQLKHERDKSIQEAYINQQSTRSRMMAAVAQGKQPLQGPPLQRQMAQRPAQPQGPGRAPAGPGATRAAPAGANLGPLGVPGVPQGMPERVAKAPQGPSNEMKRPVSPGGTPYTTEQIQQLIQLQKQRRYMQQQQAQAPDAQGGGASLSQRPPLAAPSQGAPSQMYQQGPRNAPPPPKKPRIHFAPAQVSAIINLIQTKNPNLSKEQVTKLAATYLANLQQQQQQQRTQPPQPPQHPHDPLQPPLQRPVPPPHAYAPPQPLRKGTGAYVPAPLKHPQLATLTPQERNQLQMLKAARIAQQEKQLQQQQLQRQAALQQQQSQGQPLPVTQTETAGGLLKQELEHKIRLQQQQLQLQAPSQSPPYGKASPRNK
jgi:chromatin modification-related protein VID21